MENACAANNGTLFESFTAMNVLQSQLSNYSYHHNVVTHLKLVRWWVLSTFNGEEMAVPFSPHEEDIFIKYMDDHPANFPPAKRDRFDSNNLTAPLLETEDREEDIEKPCLLVIRNNAAQETTELLRIMNIVLQNDQLPIQLPFAVVGEVILETVG